ncbi:hypothetical protein PBY51_015521 [Eleginops maclovinus]|nr:hypothetical protein PBY51_015521 [Eleginops maclovinus]
MKLHDTSRHLAAGFLDLRLPANQIQCSDQAAPYISQSQQRTFDAPPPDGSPLALPRPRKRCRVPFTLLGQRRAAAAVLPPDCRFSPAVRTKSGRDTGRTRGEERGEPEERERRAGGEREGRAGERRTGAAAPTL